MLEKKITIETANGKGRFTCSPAALLVFIVNENNEILLLSHPKRKNTWEVVNGVYEGGETLLDGALRETYEEVGSEIRVRPLGTIHAYSFHYDPNIQHMISVCFLFSYEGGDIVPGDDMDGSEYRWWKWDDIVEEDVVISVPPGRKWIIKRAIDLYAHWKDMDDIELQPELLSMGENKYDS